MTFDARWEMVRCSGCGREFQCTPDDDYFNASTAEDGVCEACLLKGAGLIPVREPVEPLTPTTDMRVIGRRRRQG